MSPLDADGNVLEFVKSIQAGQPERAFILACCSSELSAHLPLRLPLVSQHAAAAFVHLVASHAPAAAVLQQELPSEAELFATSVSKLKGIAALRYGFKLFSLVLNVVCCTWFAVDCFFSLYKLFSNARKYISPPLVAFTAAFTTCPAATSAPLASSTRWTSFAPSSTLRCRYASHHLFFTQLLCFVPASLLPLIKHPRTHRRSQFPFSSGCFCFLTLFAHALGTRDQHSTLSSTSIRALTCNFPSDSQGLLDVVALRSLPSCSTSARLQHYVT